MIRLVDTMYIMNGNDVMTRCEVGSDQHVKTLARYEAHRRIGDFVYLSGIVAADPSTGIIVNGFTDIPEEASELIGRTGEFSTDAKQGAILSQSWYVLNAIRCIVESLGGEMNDVFKLVQYFKTLDHFPYYSKVRGMFFKDVLPVSTVVEINAMLPSEQILIEVEATVWLPGNRYNLLNH